MNTKQQSLAFAILQVPKSAVVGRCGVVDVALAFAFDLGDATSGSATNPHIMPAPLATQNVCQNRMQ